MQTALKNVDTRRLSIALALAALIVVAILPAFLDPLSSTLDFGIFALAYIMFALGLNIVVGFAGLLDLGYVAFYALGALVTGWWASGHFATVNGEKGIHVGTSDFVSSLPGIHLNILLLIIGAIFICATAGALIGLPTLRLRGDYIAIVTLAFGEIIGRVFANGDEVTIFGDNKLSNGRQSIAPMISNKIFRWMPGRFDTKSLVPTWMPFSSLTEE